MNGADYRVRAATLPADAAALRRLRRAVFVAELGVPAELEWDAADAAARHVLAEDAGGRAIGCGRLLRDGQVGRLAVERAWRGRGVGAALLAALVAAARADALAAVTLDAQAGAVAFYLRAGFAAVGPAFVAGGLAHQRMRRALR